MPRDEKKRQQSLQRKTAKRKQKRQALKQTRPAGGRGLIRQAAAWPVYESLVSSNWRDEGELVQVLVARRSPSGQIAAGMFLVDLGCLGVKDAFARLFSSYSEYQQELRDRLFDLQPMREAGIDLAARIIREGVSYAGSLGFEPHRDYREAAILLEGADPDAVNVRVPLGKDGKPFYVAGPHDNVKKIMAQLTRSVGPGNFQFLAPIGGPAGLAAELDELYEDAAEEGQEGEEPMPQGPAPSLRSRLLHLLSPPRRAP